MGRAVAAFQGRAYLRVMRRFALAVLSLVLLPIPALASELTSLRDMDARIASITHRLATANAAICPDTAPLTGLLMQDVGQYAPEWRDEARTDLGLSEAPTVTVVVADSAAARAGMQVGDRILSVDGKPTPRSDAGAASYHVVETSIALLAAELSDGSAQLRVERQGKPVDIILPAERACPANVELVPGKRLSASADGKTVHVSTALATFAGRDDAVAVPIAHEMAHNILRHPQRLDAEGVKRGLLAPFGKNRSAIRATEEEADYFAAYMLARAGYDLDTALDFWRRYGAKTDLGPFNDGTHPSAHGSYLSALTLFGSITGLDPQSLGRHEQAAFDLGISPDGRVATFSWNTARHLELYFAAPCTGRVLHTLNLRLFPEQITYIVNHAEDEVIFVDKTVAGLLWPLLSTFTTVRHIVVIDDGGPFDTSEVPAGIEAVCLQSLAKDRDDRPPDWDQFAQQLSALITDCIGPGWATDLDRLEDFAPFADDGGHLTYWMSENAAVKSSSRISK